MSGFGGFGGFGSNNNNQQQQSTGFGGFGTNSNTNTGFGALNNNTGFGSTNTTGGGLFGGGSTGGFGSSGGFGNTQTSAFGAKPGGFGTTATTSGGGLFGVGTATAAAGGGGFGGFGATQTATSSPFGGTSTGGGLFGAKTGFGTTTTPSTGGLFGGGATSTPFGGTSSAFGAPASTALGGITGECQGTGSVPFQPYLEKEPNSNTNQQNAFQSICFQQPYQKFSPEELRLADYTQGRRYGNASNQPGAFGASTGFGSFGSGNQTATAGFGSTNPGTGASLFAGNTSSPFGTTQTQNTATSGSLFGQKPASGGLFGAQPTQPSGGLFGGAGTTGFGASTTGFGATNTNTGSSLFGSSNPASKPSFNFGASQPASTGTGFGTATATTGGFGSGGLFGSTQPQQNTASPFGTQQQQPAASNPFGGFGANQQQQAATPSPFGGINQQKPAGGLFGAPAATASGGLFGAPQAANSNPFGTSNNTQAGGLFGAKPAGGTGLFGTPNNTTNPIGGSSLFSNFGNQNQNQPQQNSGGLFSGLGNSSQQKPSLFSQPQQQQQGSSLFGNTGSQGGGLFGTPNNNQQQQQPQNSLFGNNSLFGGPQQGQQTPQSLTTSISDNAAYGTASLFSNLASTQINNPGPLATPLSSVSKQKKTAPLPMYKLNHSSSSRFSTPQNRGFGFSYSNYTTPTSAASTSSTPGAFGGSTFGGTFSRALSKSVSTSSLRRTFNSEDGILAPGAFSMSSGARHYGSTGSMKKLVINRSIRSDLFAPPNPQSQPSPSNAPQGGILKKRVSFDSSTVSNGANGAASPLKEVQNNFAPSSENPVSGRQRPEKGTDNSKSASPSVEIEQVPRNNELAIVHEEETTTPANSNNQAEPESQNDGQPGRYWMTPTKEEIESMNRAQKQKVSNFTVGRENVGSVTFDVPVDLSNINLDTIMGGLVLLTTRMCTVYKDNATKPPMGKGLNVPAVISLEKSWPRAKDRRTSKGDGSNAHIKKHMERLKQVPDTEFVDYEDKKGTWTFRVPHFTTYGLPDDDEDDEIASEADTDFGQSTLSAPPDTPTPSRRTTKHGYTDDSFASTSQLTVTDSDPEDTFQFKKKKMLPGAFDDQEVFEDDEEMGDDYQHDNEQSFLDERSVGSLSENGIVEPMEQDVNFDDSESVSTVDQEMAGAFPQTGNTAEHDEDSQDDDRDMDVDGLNSTPGALTRTRMRNMKNAGTSLKAKFPARNDWADTLRATISPQKQDRALLKILAAEEASASPSKAQAVPVARRVVSDGRGFATSIDIMNSLFPKTTSPLKTAKLPTKSKGFEWPYMKKTKQGDGGNSALDEADLAFHQSVKPRWGSDGTLVYATSSILKPFGRSSRRMAERDGLLSIQRGAIISEGADIRFAKFSNEASANHLKKQKAIAVISTPATIPFASLPQEFRFSDFFDDFDKGDPAAMHEKLVWQLASVLFDNIRVPEELENFPDATMRLRKDSLSELWQRLVDQASVQQVAMARSHEEKAIAALAGHKIIDACTHLLNGKNFRLATLVALIGGVDSMRNDIREQLNDWEMSKMLSEFSQPIRTIYEFLAGNVCVCNGLKGPVEDRIESFIVSKRFGLDWRQAFGLRLWYAISSSDGISTAVEKFAEDLAQEKETSKPQPWYVEQKLSTLWKDDKLETREDLMWGLLKLYVFQDTDLEGILAPENSQLSPLDMRLSWQLSQALTSAGVAQYTENAEDKTDQATLSFAAQLTNEGSWLDAVFVLLHLSSPAVRTKSIQDHLATHAGLIGGEDSDAFATLTTTFKIPSSWVWEAKALFMRSVEKNPQEEVRYLISAKAFNEAHKTFCQEVAPRAIVERDYANLHTMLSWFDRKETPITEWHVGGKIYADFLDLLESVKKGKTVDYATLDRLLTGIPAAAESARHPSFLETVAMQTMGDTVAKCVLAAAKKADEKSGLAKLLRLPLTEDKYLRHTVDLSLEYYRAVMATAR